MSFNDTTNGIAVGDSGSVVRTTDGGVVWLPEAGLWPSEVDGPDVQKITALHLRGVSFADTSRGIVVGDSGVVLHTVDGGANWTLVQSGISQRLLAVRMLDMNRVIAVGDSGASVCSTDGGLTWAQQSIRTSNALYSIGSIDANKSAVVGEGGTIMGPAPGIVTSVEERRRMGRGTRRDSNCVCFSGKQRYLLRSLSKVDA